jgi:hypothetical protein
MQLCLTVNEVISLHKRRIDKINENVNEGIDRYMKEKKDGLIWFLDFLNLEVQMLSQEEMEKWATEALYMIEFGKPRLWQRVYPVPEKIVTQEKIDVWVNSNRLFEYQMFIKNFLVEALSNIERSISTRTVWTPRKKFRFQSFISEFKTFATLRLQVPAYSGLNVKTENKGKKNEETYYRIDKSNFQEANFHFSFLSKSEKKSFLIVFCQNLEGVPIKSLRRCTNCDNWFLHISKREKKFCTNKCAASYLGRLRREKLKLENSEVYQKELREGAKRARKSYEKKKKKEIRNNIKIARRPTKYKE